MPPKSRRAERCVYIEGGVRCRRSGTGDPSLCNPHRIVMRDAGRPQQPLGGIADLVERVFTGRRVSRKTWEGAIRDAAAILEQQAQASANASNGQQTSNGGFRPGPGFQPPDSWREFVKKQQQKWAPPQPLDPKIEERRRARITLGFAPSEPVTLEVLQRRRRELARKHHPDRGGSVAKMQAVNAAADVLEAELGPRTATP